jgi:hypothetical protein
MYNTYDTLQLNAFFTFEKVQHIRHFALDYLLHVAILMYVRQAFSAHIYGDLSQGKHKKLVYYWIKPYLQVLNISAYCWLTLSWYQAV